MEEANDRLDKLFAVAAKGLLLGFASYWNCSHRKPDEVVSAVRITEADVITAPRGRRADGNRSPTVCSAPPLLRNSKVRLLLTHAPVDDVCLTVCTSSVTVFHTCSDTDGDGESDREAVIVGVRDEDAVVDGVVDGDGVTELTNDGEGVLETGDGDGDGVLVVDGEIVGEVVIDGVIDGLGVKLGVREAVRVWVRDGDIEGDVDGVRDGDGDGLIIPTTSLGA